MGDHTTVVSASISYQAVLLRRGHGGEVVLEREVAAMAMATVDVVLAGVADGLAVHVLSVATLIGCDSVQAVAAVDQMRGSSLLRTLLPVVSHLLLIVNTLMVLTSVVGWDKLLGSLVFLPLVRFVCDVAEQVLHLQRCWVDSVSAVAVSDKTSVNGLAHLLGYLLLGFHVIPVERSVQVRGLSLLDPVAGNESLTVVVEEAPVASCLEKLRMTGRPLL